MSFNVQASSRVLNVSLVGNGRAGLRSRFKCGAMGSYDSSGTDDNNDVLLQD